MAYTLIKTLPGITDNIHLFYLDNGAQDLPPIIDHDSIKPGSEAHDISTTDLWILNSDYQWEKVPWKEKEEEDPSTPTVPEVPSVPDMKYLRATNDAGDAYWLAFNGLEDIDPYTSTASEYYARQMDDAGNVTWQPVPTVVLEQSMTLAEWAALAEKPDFAQITDSKFDCPAYDNIDAV